MGLLRAVVKPAVVTLAIGLVFRPAGVAHAVGSRTFELDTLDELGGGDQ